LFSQLKTLSKAGAYFVFWGQILAFDMEQKIHDFFLFGLCLLTHAKALALALLRHGSRLAVYADCTNALFCYLRPVPQILLGKILYIFSEAVQRPIMLTKASLSKQCPG